jgi:hypothetical protein
MKCSVDMCNEPVESRGWCNAHYLRWRKTGDVEPSRPIQKHRRQSSELLDLGKFVCGYCERELPLIDRSRASMCRSCSSKKRREWQLANYERDQATARRVTLRRRGQTLDSFHKMLEAQNGRCALCLTAEPGGRHKQWHVDHDHWCCPSKDLACGRCVRCLLCQACNTNNFGDDPALLERRASQIRAFRAANPWILEKHLGSEVAS